MGCSDCKKELDLAIERWTEERDWYLAQATDLRVHCLSQADELEASLEGENPEPLGDVVRRVVEKLVAASRKAWRSDGKPVSTPEELQGSFPVSEEATEPVSEEAVHMAVRVQRGPVRGPAGDGVHIRGGTRQLGVSKLELPNRGRGPADRGRKVQR